MHSIWVIFLIKCARSKKKNIIYVNVVFETVATGKYLYQDLTSLGFGFSVHIFFALKP